ncbi:thiamine pyrophosphate-binding protein [Miltoncostaea oceani]|uniref:thiamine pyrophosphate-binding protein n=1 Tax=Miltoncostaea oceani TaxID=2843216 RepID=UPI001C3D7FDB|nr:thiamine pyrophosphate-binding protein [Miltoncostaea oceani]
MNGADWLLTAIAAEGVTHLFGNPGSTELPITDALGRQSAVQYVLGLHETTVVGMADGWAQATGGLAVANVHVQPGLANAMSAILNAARCRVPVLVTVGQQWQSMLPGDPFLGGELVAMAAPVAKGAWEVASPAELPEAFARAVRTAMTHPRGPVVLSIPLDVQVAPAPPPHVPVPVPGAPAPSPADLDAAAALLAGAAAPALIAGDGVAHMGAVPALAALAERLGAPVLGEPMGALATLPTDHPLWRGPLPPFAADIRPVLEPFDVVVAAGMPVFRLFGHSAGPAVPVTTALVHLEVDPAEIGKVHAPAAGVPGDVAASLTALVARLGAPTDASEARREAAEGSAADARATGRARVAGAADGDRISPSAFATAVAGAVGPDDLVVDEALTSGRGLRAVVGPRRHGTWIAHRGSALGWGLPAAVGAALADRDRRVLALQGDGSLLFGVHALWTAAHEGLPIALVVADNGGYEILRAGLEGMTGRPEGDWPGLRLDAPRLGLEGICRGFGATADRVDDRAALPAALDDLWRRAATGPAVLVVGVEGSTPPVGYPLA